jgi:hypothetical protein
LASARNGRSVQVAAPSTGADGAALAVLDERPTETSG